MDAVGEYTPEDLPEALRPIVSLISKSEKAQQKLKPGSWQHTMLRDNLKALRLAVALMIRETEDAREGMQGVPVQDLNQLPRDDLQDALRALASMIGKAEKAQAGFAPGTAQHSLQRNRLRALRIAERLVRMEMDGG